MFESLLEAALTYSGLGWSIIPTQLGQKKAHGRWKKFQTQPAGRAQLESWFGNGNRFGIAVLLGGVSGQLASRDFDDLSVYQKWAAENPGLAKTLPTVCTSRGRHVYFRTTEEKLAEFRRSIGNPAGNGAIDLGDGEFRADVGCYNLLPPSLHPSGVKYEWENEIGEEIPDVDIASVLTHSPSFFVKRETTNVLIPPDSSDCSASSEVTAVSGSPDASGLRNRIAEAVDRTLPKKRGRRHRSLFEFARELKAIPELADADSARLKEIVRVWHFWALPIISTKPFEDSWFDFAESWERVRFAAGEGPLDRIFERATAAKVPDVASDYQLKLQLLVAFCRELQREVGDSSTFFIGVVKVADLLEIDQGTASRWLRGLRRDRVLELVKKGSRVERKTNEYRYIAGLTQ